MATSKRRINVSLSDTVDTVLKEVAKRDDMPEATKAAQLIQLGLEIEEDAVLDRIARERDVPGVKYIEHTDNIW